MKIVPGSSRSNGAARTVAGALLAVLVGLLLIGFASGTILRHVVQALPASAVALTAARRVAWSRYAAMAVFAFWLGIMLLIWLHLLGLANVVTGRFTPVEVGLSIAVGLACMAGLVAATRGGVRLPWRIRVTALAVAGALQVGSMWLSLQPALANR